MSDKSKRRGGLLRGNIGVMILTSGIWTLAGSMTGPFFSLYVLELGGNYVDIGLISALGALIRVLPSLVGGYLADSVGRKRMVYSMSFLLSLNQLLYAFAPHYEFLLIAISLDALWGGLRGPAFSAIIADSTRPENRALSYAVWQIVPPLFGLLSPYLIGVLMDRYGILRAMRWAYLAVFVASSIASFLRYKLLEETLPLENRRGTGLRRALRETFSDFKVTFKSLPKQLWAMLGVNFILNFAYSLCGPYFVTYAKDEIGLTAAQWGFISTIITLIGTGVRLPAAWASDRYGRLKFILPSLFLMPITFFLFMNAEGFSQVMMIRVAMAALDSLQGPAGSAILIDFSPREHRGRINAIIGVSGGLLSSAGSLMGGVLYQGVSTEAPFFTASALLLAGAVYALLTLKEPREREE